MLLKISADKEVSAHKAAVHDPVYADMVGRSAVETVHVGESNGLDDIVQCPGHGILAHYVGEAAAGGLYYVDSIGGDLHHIARDDVGIQPDSICISSVRVIEHRFSRAHLAAPCTQLERTAHVKDISLSARLRDFYRNGVNSYGERHGSCDSKLYDVAGELERIYVVQAV